MAVSRFGTPARSRPSRSSLFAPVMHLSAVVSRLDLVRWSTGLDALCRGIDLLRCSFDFAIFISSVPTFGSSAELGRA
eukprot:2054330-Pyramimonas_sp.AAC.1